MAKRKLDSSLDGIIINYLKRGKCEKTLKLFEGRIEGAIEDINTSKMFWNHLQRKEAEKESAKDDLGFEINFGAYQIQSGENRFSEQTLDSSARKSSAGTKIRNEKSDKKENIDIPKEFIEKIKELED